MKVYRLEGKDGYGVFCGESGIGYKWSDDAVYSTNGNTTGRDLCDSSYRYGCESIDQLIEYFGSEFDADLEEGAELVEYTINKRYVTFSPKGIEVAFLIDRVSHKQVLIEGRAW